MENNIKVLLTDDEERFLLSTARILIRRGYIASTARNGKEAIASIKKEKVDVVVLDIRMPELDGIETLKELKRIDPEVEVILLTGHASVDTAVEGMKLGAREFLIKPCDTEDLTDKIDRAYEAKITKKKRVLPEAKEDLKKH